MNLLRIIKIKKIDGDLDSLDEKESLFISLFNGLKLVEKYDKQFYIGKNKVPYFWYVPADDTFVCYYSYTYLLYVDNFNLTYFEITALISNILEQHLNFKVKVVKSNIEER